MPTSSLKEAFENARPLVANNLKRTIVEWTKDDPAHADQTPMGVSEPPAPPEHLFKPTTNVTRASFEFVKLHPGISQRDATKQLAAQGFNENSVSSLLPNMVRQGLLRRTDDMRLYPKVQEYRPLKGSTTIRKIEAARAERKGAVRAPVKEHARVENDVTEEVLSRLNIFQAQMLYAKLKTMFEKNA